MGKRMKKLILAAIVTIMMLSTSMVAFAADGSALKTLRATTTNNKGKVKVVKSVTLYAGKEIVDASSTPNTVTLNVEAKTDLKSSKNDGKYVVLSADKSIATVDKVSSSTTDGSDYYKIVITAKKAGKTTVTLTDPNNVKKQHKINVTVKGLTDNIAFGNSVKSTRSTINRMYIANGGSLALGATSNQNAKTKLSYSVTSQWTLDKNGKYQALNSTNKKDAVVVVTGKGLVSAKKTGKAIITVTALDQKSGKTKTGYKETVTVFVSDGQTTSMSVKKASGNITQKGKGYVLELKTNEDSPRHTYDGFDIAINRSTSDGTDDGMDKALFTSNKPAVATVDENGKITGVSNGTAKITISPADGTKSKAIKNIVVTVKVTTDIEDKYINIPNKNVTIGIGQSSKLGVTVDKKVTGKNKTLTYSVKNAGSSGLAVNPKTGKLSVAKTGNTAEDITVLVKSANPGADGKVVEKEISVRVINPVKTLKATVPTYKKSGIAEGKATTLYLNNRVESSTYDGMDTLNLGTLAGYDKTGYKGTVEGDDKTYTSYSFDKCKVKLNVGYAKAGQKATVDGLLNDNKLTFSSSKPTVAKVDQWGNITAVGKGKAVITVATNDGGKKKAKISVTVVQKVDQLSVANESKQGVYLVANKATSLKAVTNADANLKTATFTFKPEKGVSGTINCTAKGKFTMKGVTVPKDSDELYLGTLTVTANDAAKYNNPQQKPCVKVVDVYACSGNGQIKKEDIDLGSHDGLSIKKGTSSSELSALIDIPGNVINRELVWTVDDKKVLTIDKNYGTITGKNEGTAVVTVKPKKGSSVSSEARIRVGASDEEYRNMLDEQLKFALNAEDYDWTGTKPTYEQGQETIYLDYTDGFEESKADGSLKNNIKNLYEVFLDAFADASFRSATVVDEQDGTVYDFVREGLNVKAYKNGKLVSGNAMSDKYKLLDTFGKGKTPADYAGTSYQVTILKESKLVKGGIQYSTLVYTADYRIVFASNGEEAANGVADSEVLDMDGIVDGRIADAIASIEYDKASTGISSVDYDADTNTVIVNIYNGSMKIADTANSKARTTVLNTCKSVFKELDKATVKLTSYGAELKDYSGEYSRERGDNTNVDAAVNRILDNMVAKLTEKNILELRMLDNTEIHVSAKFSNYVDAIEYNVKFSLNADAMIDGAILEQADAEYNGGLKDIAYDSVNNIVTITMNSGATLKDNEKEAIKNILNAFTKYDPNKAVYVKSVLDAPYGIITVRSGAEMDSMFTPEFLNNISKFKSDDCVFIKNTYSVNGASEVVNYTIELKVAAKQNTKSTSSLDGTVDGEDAVVEAETTVSDGNVEAVSEGDVAAAVSTGDVAEAVAAAQ